LARQGQPAGELVPRLPGGGPVGRVRPESELGHHPDQHEREDDEPGPTDDDRQPEPDEPEQRGGGNRDERGDLFDLRAPDEHRRHLLAPDLVGDPGFDRAAGEGEPDSPQDLGHDDRAEVGTLPSSTKPNPTSPSPMMIDSLRL